MVPFLYTLQKIFGDLDTVIESLPSTWAIGVVVSRPLCMRKAVGSNPTSSTAFFRKFNVPKNNLKKHRPQLFFENSIPQKKQLKKKEEQTPTNRLRLPGCFSFFPDCTSTALRRTFCCGKFETWQTFFF